MSNKRIEGPKVVIGLLVLIAAILAWAFYRYYTVEPDEVWDVEKTHRPAAPQAEP